MKLLNGSVTAITNTARRFVTNRSIIYFFVFISGGLSTYGFSPYGWYGLPIASIGVLFFLWRKYPSSAGVLGWLFGCGWFLSGVSWFYTTFHVYGHLGIVTSLLVLALFSAFLAAYTALAGALFFRFRLSSDWQLAALWTTQEWLRRIIFTGFPWLTTGYSQIPASPLAALAPWGGIFAVSFACALLAAWLSRMQLRSFLYSGLLLVSCYAIGYITWTQPDRPPISVSLIQGNIDQADKWRPESLEMTLVAYARMVQASHAQLVILPETAIPVLATDIPSEYFDDLSRSAISRHADVLFGVPEQIDSHYFNSLMSIGSATTQVYRKVHLVPFGEFIPMHQSLGRLLDILGLPMSDFSSGATHQPAIHVAGQSIGADICYEDAFGDEIIRALPQAGILVNITNDAWFGRTTAAWQHAQMSQARALETGRYMLRATNTGITAIIDAKGRFVARLPVYTRATLNGFAQSFTGATPYVRFGDFPVLLLCSALLLPSMLSGVVLRIFGRKF